jgi:hypothetical protein
MHEFQDLEPVLLGHSNGISIDTLKICKFRALKLIVALCLLLTLFSAQPLTASTEARSGAKCGKAGKVMNSAGTKFVCAKSGKKLRWIVVSVASTTTTTVAPSTTTAVAATTTTTTSSTTTTTTTTTSPIATDRTPPVVTLLRGAGSSSSSTLTFTVTGDENIRCSTLSSTYDEDFTWDKISIISAIVQTSPTVCTITAHSTAERDNDDHLATLRASARFSITDTAGNVQTRLLGSPQSTTVRRA